MFQLGTYLKDGLLARASLESSKGLGSSVISATWLVPDTAGSPTVSIGTDFST